MDDSDGHDDSELDEATTATSTPLAMTTPRLDSGAHRRHQRVRTDAVLVKLRVGQGTLVATVVDISLGGFYAATTHDHMIPIGAFVELTVLQSGTEEIDIGGVVVADAAHRPGLAVRFEA
ncbi:MAG TPA: PilZ domain-containing protein, partial [Myxococcota bacterium]